MRVGLYGKHFNPEFDGPVGQLIEELDASGVGLVIYEDFYPFLNERLKINGDYKTFCLAKKDEMDVLISIGGDGTLLNSVPVVRDSEIPVLGVNTGRLGFLSNVSIDSISQTVKHLVAGEFSTDKRQLIAVKSSKGPLGEFDFAFNEVTLHKKDSSSMVTVEVMINGEFMNNYWADGLIVSTPTGSTAYSLSCGGPIAMPGTKNWIFTPIAPHNLNVRPLLVPNEMEVQIKATGRESNHLLTIDSRCYTIDSETILTLNCAPFTLNLVNLAGQHFFKTIRGKMNWGFDQRNRHQEG